MSLQWQDMTPKEEYRETVRDLRAEVERLRAELSALREAKAVFSGDATVGMSLESIERYQKLMSDRYEAEVERLKGLLKRARKWTQGDLFNAEIDAALEGKP